MISLNRVKEIESKIKNFAKVLSKVTKNCPKSMKRLETICFI